MARTRDAPALWRHAKRIEGVGRVTGTVCSWVEAVALRDELKEDGAPSWSGLNARKPECRHIDWE